MGLSHLGWKITIVKWLAKGTPHKIITHFIGRLVDTVKRFLADKFPRKTRWVSVWSPKDRKYPRDFCNLKRLLFKKPEQTSEHIFDEVNLPEVSESAKFR